MADTSDRFSGSRLDLARRRRGLTKAGLATTAGVSTRSLALYINDDREPSSETIQKLALATGFPDSFFYGQELPEPAVGSVSFRSLASMTARTRDQALGSATLATHLADWIDEHFELPPPNVPRLRDTSPEYAAEHVRTVWNLGEGRIPNLVHLLEVHGVRVFSLAPESREVDGFSFWRDGTPYVFLNTMKSAERSRMDAAHELGHLVMHFWSGTGSGDAITDLERREDTRTAEEEAKRFAAAFLMPERSVLASAPRFPSVDAVVQAKRKWNVAAVALAYRMRTVGLLSEWHARSLMIEMSKLGYRTNEPNPIPHESSQLLAKVLRGLRTKGMATVDLARALNTPVEELNHVMFGLVLTPLTGAGAGGGNSASLELAPPG